jgi:cytochrome c553
MLRLLPVAKIAALTGVSTFLLTPSMRMLSFCWVSAWHRKLLSSGCSQLSSAIAVSPASSAAPRRFSSSSSVRPWLITGAASAKDADKVSARELQAKLAYCENCHGASAQGFHGYYPIPRLAGQQPEYMKNQLEAFVEHRRSNNIMFNVAHELSPAMLDALTESFQKLNPKPLTGFAAEDLIAAGKSIYEEGLPKSDVPPCAGCHGSEAKGDGQFPRLARLSHHVFE